ncbi:MULTISPECIES: ATP-binding protein [Streptomyces]|uniref:ATP-binding protein n=1 Tax=Streptomyces TaxID=1883 RepID=UPI000996C453|nr:MULTISPECIES: ATP-binding protein [unclassified Streptomyces]RPK44122.1 Histidine kinase-, DNA gyrase B-, and HSP90-like ATPase [Streptomyces sp. ADI91-18]WSX95816.1 ATP-binding protein [Streptomyces goshikiensis]
MCATRPSHSHSFPIAAENQAVPKARHLVLAVVRGWDLQLTGETLEELALLCSEIIANAVRHTTGPSTLTVRWTGSRLRVEVTDTTPGLPAPRNCSLNAESGRGLMLIAAIATDWGTTPTPTGKAVWFEMTPTATDEENGQHQGHQTVAGKPTAPARRHPVGVRQTTLETHGAGRPR